MKLSIYYAYLQKYDPDLANPEIEQYCNQSDELPEQRSVSKAVLRTSDSGLPTSFHYGYKSLKWAMYQIEEIDPKRLKHVFKAIMIEHKAREKSILDIQYNILNYAAMAEYKQTIRAQAKPTIDLETIGHFTAGNFVFVINNTTENLTARIFRDTNADAILFRNPETLAAGIIFRTSVSVPPAPVTELVEVLSASEPGWKQTASSQQPAASIVNHGAPSGTATTHTIETLQQIICTHFD